MMRLTLRIVGRALLGTEIGDEADAVGQALPVALHWANEQITRPSLSERLPTPGNRRFRSAVGSLNGVVNGLVAQRRKSGEDPGDLLSMLMKATDAETGEAMSDQQLRDEVMTIFLAGHETTANALAWTFMLLSLHPGVDRTLRAELSSVLAGRLPTLADLPKLTYTRMVLDEALRLYPPAWSLGRRAEVDDVIDGYAIPKGSLVIVSPYVVHHNARVWDNPEGFDPERFRPGKEEGLPRFAYFPFGGGPRLCIGNNFALMEAQLLLAVLAQRARPELLAGHPVELEPMITLRPKGGLPMRLARA
jgi:cytochrome P450